MLLNLFDQIVFSLTKPGREEINQLIAVQNKLPFSYAEVGASRELLP